MGLIERIKSALGLGTSASSPSSPSSSPDGGAGDEDEDEGGSGPTPVSEVEGDEHVEGAQTIVDPGDDGHDATSDGADVTVEHEPDTRSEDAVKGTDTAGTGTSADVEPAGESGATDTAGADADGPTAGDDATEGEGVALEEIKGIGPAYADRLRDAGIEDVAALSAADAAELADRTGLGEGRVGKWIDRAGAR